MCLSRKGSFFIKFLMNSQDIQLLSLVIKSRVLRSSKLLMIAHLREHFLKDTKELSHAWIGKWITSL